MSYTASIRDALRPWFGIPLSFSPRLGGLVLMTYNGYVAGCAAIVLAALYIPFATLPYTPADYAVFSTFITVGSVIAFASMCFIDDDWAQAGRAVDAAQRVV